MSSSPSDNQLADYFAREVARTFDFLVSEHGFSSLGLSVDGRTHLAEVIYVRQNLGVECILDAREEDVDCKVFRLIDGRKPKHFDVDDEGRVVREGVWNLLTRRGVRAKLFRGAGHLAFSERIPQTLEDFAQMLRAYGKDILEDSPEALG